MFKRAIHPKRLIDTENAPHLTNPRALADPAAEFARINGELKACGMKTAEEVLIEEARAQVEALKAKQAQYAASESAKGITDTESGEQWMKHHFCSFVASKRI
jgi:hypothetical protein